jgi:predicted nucleic acid-binding protein
MVVADTSPLLYLLAIRLEWVLPEIFGGIIAPSEVLAELNHPSAPPEARQWLRILPPWVEIRSPVQEEKLGLPGHLGAGERAAIEICVHFGLDTVLMDDRRARNAAMLNGLKVVGTIGVIDAAAERRLIDVGDAVRALQATNFRCAPELLRQLLRRQTDAGDSG